MVPQTRVNLSYCHAAAELEPAEGAFRQSAVNRHQEALQRGRLALIITDFHTLAHVRYRRWIMQTADLNLRV